MADQLQSVRAVRRLRPETSAWLMLWLFFFLFCGLVALAGFASWRYYSDAMAPLTAQVRVYASGGVLLQEHDNAAAFIPKDICGAVTLPEPRPDLPPLCADITEGFRVEAIPQMGYGQVASIVFPDKSQIDMWAHPTGADITLPVAQASRWTDQRRMIELNQSAGYARYDIKDGHPYRQSGVIVRINDSVWVDLAPEGSYSVHVPREPQDGQLRSALARTRKATLVEVAVRNSGRATVWSSGRSRVVDPGQKVAVESSGMLQPATPANWQLIADGDFTQGEPRSVAAGDAAWQSSGGPLAPDLKPEELNGVFRVVRQCPPTKVDYCLPNDQVQIGQFRRDGNQPKPYVTRIRQLLDTDISEYRTLRFTAWVRVLTQTVPLAGVNQGECPLFLRLGYKQTTPNDQLQERQICVYTASEATGLAGTEVGGVLYQQVPPYNWYQIDLNLRNDPQIRTVRYLESITIEARGHDYLSQITAISLIGEQ